MKAKRPTQIYDLVEVVWDDACGMKHGWTAKDEPIEPFIVLSVGFLLRETTDHILIAQDTDGEGGHNGRSQIPKGMIKSMRVLRKKKANKDAKPSGS